MGVLEVLVVLVLVDEECAVLDCSRRGGSTHRQIVGIPISPPCTSSTDRSIDHHAPGVRSDPRTYKRHTLQPYRPHSTNTAAISGTWVPVADCATPRNSRRPRRRCSAI